MIRTSLYHTPFGTLLLGSYGDKLCLSDWIVRPNQEHINLRLAKGLACHFMAAKSEVTTLAMEQLDQYFQGKRQKFDLPLLLVGTEFQKEVWNGLLTIPYGKTWSYKELAQHIGNPGAVRAVGTANGANSMSVIIPCHRVVATGGGLGGYSSGVGIKQQLLHLESSL